ncbi:hypothetical protein SAMN04489724_0264 [Algoriphagus locisalis]|uniref:Outer membrane protein beta-barrel domain-containing protein n=1 Tax=Algoriphagus locisalis TaxID=305507 RepID=A0A1I7E8D7_9BACT|nr:hypothetical protein [Algoriphagus locisalis]SFU20191.1 hypothetical protein SAMN04489724_0264 [Algoriphagus locisalis]
MKKLLIIGAFLTAFINSSYGQEGTIRVNPAVMLGVPIGDFSEVYGMGVGIGVKGLYSLNTGGELTFSTGYTRFGLKDSYAAGLKGSLGIIPLLAGYRHHLERIYLEPQLGLSINSSTIKGSFLGMDSFGGSASSTSLGYAATVGYFLGDIDLSLRYQGLALSGDGLGFIGIRVGYQFKLKN